MAHEECGAGARGSSTNPLAGPVGSAYDRDRRASRRIGGRLKSLFTEPIIALLAIVIPYAIYAYCWLVWKTSRVDDQLTGPLMGALERHGRFVAGMWHHQVGTVAYAYKHIHGHTLASTKTFGRLITPLLELCNYTVFRGASGKRTSSGVLDAMIAHMQTWPGNVPYGITVDGPRGPRHRMKRGVAAIARACRAPVMLTECSFSRRIVLPTWDGCVIPLPFGRIRLDAIGPYWIEPDTSDEELLQAVAHYERDLLELFVRSHEIVDRGASPTEGPPLPGGGDRRWTERWGLTRLPYDLQPNAPPPWAVTREEAFANARRASEAAANCPPADAEAAAAV